MKNGITMLGWMMVGATLAGAGETPGETPLRVRVNNFTVQPSTGPVTHVVVRNHLATAFTGSLRVEWPAGWNVTPAGHDLALRPGQLKTLAFTIERGADVAANVYPVRVRVADGGGREWNVAQQVVCASAPYHKPVIDGDLTDWRDAIPITFATAGRPTTVRAYWNGKRFALAVEVDEDKLIGTRDATAETGLDALQFALAPADGDGRWEFLVACTDAAAGSGRCVLLRQPGPPAAAAPRRLADLKSIDEAQVAVTRDGRRTRYELSLPFALMPDLRPTAGREFRFSLLVHDPDATGVRDLGEVMNRWPEDRQPDGWCSWEWVRWGKPIPYSSKIEFGFCSSIH